MNPEFEGLSLVELIDLLQEVPEPPEVPLTPQTPGWIVLGLLVAALAFFLVRWLWQRWRNNAYRREAIRALQQTPDDAAAIAAILRRTALAAYPRAEIAALSGDRWLAFLDKTYPGAAFGDGPGHVIALAPYRAQPASPELRRAATTWIRKHKVPA